MSHLIANADARRIPLADESVHAVITSPPYWGLRDYKVAGQIGLEKSPDAYVAEMVAVFREVYRVLREDGVCWLNLGDSYGGDRGNKTPAPDSKYRSSSPASVHAHSREFDMRGNLIGIPWRVALALQADGWVLRSEIIWHKRSPMPESVKTRPTRAHEHVFLLAKSPKYFYDWFAVREKANQPDRVQTTYKRPLKDQWAVGPMQRGEGDRHGQFRDEDRVWCDGSGRNLRSVWTLSSEPWGGAHFATFPRKLVIPCIKAGTSQRGCCPACGAQWVRETEATKYTPKLVPAGQRFVDPSRGDKTRKLSGKEYNEQAKTKSLGFRPSCPCPPHEPQPSVVLDPFGGAGTVPLVAEALGRRGIATELNPDYCRMALQRIRRPHRKHVRPDDGRAMPLFSGLVD